MQQLQDVASAISSGATACVGIRPPSGMKSGNSVMEQPDFATNPHAVLSDRVVIAMVGLPARGKSYISKAIVRYLELLGCPARLFNAGNKRRQEGSAGVDAKFFDAANADAKQQRERMAMETLDELLVWLQNETRPDAGCACGIFDATNTTKARREKVRQRIARENPPVRLIFVESVCNDVATLENNYRMKLSNDDYRGTDPEAAYRDFKERVRQYEIVYEPVDDESECRPFCAEELRSRPARADLLLREGAGLHGDDVSRSEADNGQADPSAGAEEAADRAAAESDDEDDDEGAAAPPPTPGCLKLIDAGRKLVKTSCEGPIANELLNLLHSIHLGPRCIWITLVGETNNDCKGILGGDSSLSADGMAYARAVGSACATPLCQTERRL